MFVKLLHFLILIDPHLSLFIRRASQPPPSASRYTSVLRERESNGEKNARSRREEETEAAACVGPLSIGNYSLSSFHGGERVSRKSYAVVAIQLRLEYSSFFLCFPR